MKRFKKSLGHALAGFSKAYREERNMKIHTVLALIVLIVSYLVGLNWWEWLFIFSAITLVFVAELVNTIFERFIDMVHPTVNDYVRDMKDMMAASVVLTSIYALIVGLVILFPKVIQIVASLVVGLI